MLSRSWLLVLWCGLSAPSQAARVVRTRAQTDRLSSLNTSFGALVEVSNDDLSNTNRDQVLDLKIEPQELLAGVILGIAGFNFSGNISEQIGTLASATFGSALTMVNPILGAFFSVFAGLLRMDGADPEKALMKNILSHVDKMIKGSIDKFKNELIGAEIIGTMRTVRRTDTAAEYNSLTLTFTKEIVKIFTKPCWSTPDGSTCKTWQTEGGGGGNALIYEIKYIHVMISTYLEILRLAQSTTTNDEDKNTYKDIQKDLAVDIQAAAWRCVKHANRWKAYRMLPSNFELGTRVNGGGGDSQWMVFQGRDRTMHSGDRRDWETSNNEFTGAHCLATPRNHRRRFQHNEFGGWPPGTPITKHKWGRRRHPQNRIIIELNACRDDWIKSARIECDDLVDQAEAIQRVADKLPSR